MIAAISVHRLLTKFRRHCISSHISRCKASAVAAVLACLIADPAQAGIFFTPFGTNGEGGSVNGQVLFFGSGGEVFELDAFVNIAGMDLNGAAAGTSAQLSTSPLPAGLALAFNASLSGDESDLTLTYTLTNNTGATLPGLWFATFVDAEIDVAINDYFNEAAGQLGTLGAGPVDSDPDEWEADEPGYVFGDIFTGLLSGTLDNSNAVSEAAPEDVSLALGFRLGDLAPGNAAIIQVLLSDAGNSLGSFSLQHFDTDIDSFDVLTVSGSAMIVPEPSTFTLAVLAALVLWPVCRRSTKSIPGTTSSS